MNKRLVVVCMSAVMICYSTAHASENNPYALFNSSTAATTNDSNTTGTQNIQYATPASQVGTTQTYQPNDVKFNQTNYVNQPGNPSKGDTQPILNGGLAASATDSIPDLTNTNNLLQTIANNTGSANGTTVGNTASLLSYFTQDYSQDSFIPQMTGYNDLNNAVQNAAGVETLRTKFGTAVNLEPTVTGNSIRIPFLSSLQDTTSENSGSSYWLPAASNAVTNLALSQKVMDDLSQAVNAPSGSGWITNIQTASEPQLLRTLIVQQALQNKLLYQSLMQQRDQELMQAAELSMLQEVINMNTQAINNANSEQLKEQKRFLRALQDLSEQVRRSGG